MSTGMEELKQDLLASGRIIVHQGLADAFAHVSIRLPGEERILFMPPKSPALLREEDLFVLGFKEKAPQASLHSAIYRNRPDVGAAIHTHSPKVVSLSLLGRTVEPIHNYSAIFYEGVPLYDRGGHIGDEVIAEEIVQAMGKRRAIVLKGHGAFIVGQNVREACLLAIFLEESARYYLETLWSGGPQRLSPEEAQRVGSETCQPSSIQRGWEHFKTLALRQLPL